ncbi:MAG: ABC transporter permease [Isosphaeraceae bacterium]|nr:ABC transporter permease [Isosphaeraceae bacterium]
MSRYASLRELYLTRLREFYRQPARIFWVYFFPTILAICLGFAFRSRPPEAVAFVLVDNAATGPIQAALETKEAQTGRPGRPGLRFQTLTPEEAMHRLKTGKTALVVEPETSGAVRYHFDPTRPEANVARMAVDDALQRAQGRLDPIPTADDRITEPGSRYIDFLIPGLIGLNTMGGGMWGIGFLLVNFRIAKLLKRFMATPMPRANFLLALLGARLTFLVPDVGVLLLMGVFAFGMPIRGSLAVLALVEVAGALAFAGLGLLVGSRARTTETVSGLMNLVMLPMWLFSGVFFSSDRFPAPLQPFIQALPLTQLNNALRLVILEGADLTSPGIVLALAILTAWAVGTFALALRLFRWT